MSESVFRFVDPLSYHVNNITKIDVDVSKAYLEKDEVKIQQLSSANRQKHEVFIVVNSNQHASVLLIPAPQTVDILPKLYSNQEVRDPFEIEANLQCYICELRYDDMSIKTYMIDFKPSTLANFRNTIVKRFYIGQYIVGSNGMQLAAMQAAPAMYSVMRKDCLEFAKCFSIKLLEHCDKPLEIERLVRERIQKATITGLRIERFSRNNAIPGIMGNASLATPEGTTFMINKSFASFVWFIFGVFSCFFVMKYLL